MIRLKLVHAGCALVPDERFRRWLFLGQNHALEAACVAAMPADRRLDVTHSFQDIADRLRCDFAREVSRIGAEQKDLLGWCSSTFAWKTPGASDLFLLSCYRLLIRKLAIDQTEPTLILLEDPWLYEECRRDGGLRQPIAASAPPVLWILKAWLALRGLGGRILWFMRTAMSLTRQRLLSRPRGNAAAENPNYAVYSLPAARCFGAGAGWADPYLPGLEAMISQIGGGVLRFAPCDPYGFERELARRSDIVHPLILNAGLMDILAALMTFWRPKSLTSYALEGVSMPLLAEREWWTDAGSARWCGYRLFDACFRRFLGQEKPVAVIFPYENQPWEKLICAASSGTGTVTIGYQHALVPRFYLGYWSGPEGPGTPLPDHILASGPLQRDILIDAGTASAKIQVGGALRYRYLSSSSGKPRSHPPGSSRILVVSNSNPGITLGILEAVRSAFPEAGARDGLELFFRPHPAAAPGLALDLRGMTTVKGELSSRLVEFDLIISAGSTVAFEARLLGVPVILFRPAVVLDAQDPGNLFPERFFEYTTAAEIRETVLRRLNEPKNADFDAVGLRDAVFSPVDEKVWRGCLTDHLGFDNRKS